MPSLVRKNSIRADAQNLRIVFLKFLIKIGRFSQFCGADESKISRIKKQNEPFSPIIRKLYFLISSS